jgi:tRNA nucleotidyltransferase (CCA-adding enzyme)
MNETFDPSVIPDAAIEICRTLVDRGHGAWIVGGCVRDHLLGRTVNDWDICTSARPRELMKYFPKVIPTGIDHGTVTVVRDHAHYEVTTLRGEEGYTDGRRPDKVFFLNDVREDLARRDFTVNAIAYDPLGRVLVDPFHGLDDLKLRVLRAVGVATQRFQEDGLRILRGARFVAALEFDLDPVTEAAMAECVSVFRKVSAERVRDEWVKAMKAVSPSRAFRVMLRTGILDAVCPDLAALAPSDMWEHTLHTVDAAPRGSMVRFAALLMHLREGDSNIEAAETWMKSWRFSNEERSTIVHLLRHHNVHYTPVWNDVDVRRFLQRITPAALDDFFALFRAKSDNAHLDAFRQRVDTMVSAGVCLTPRELAIDGTVLMKELGMKPSRQLGETLGKLLEKVIEEPALNTRESLLSLARTLVATA